MTLHSRVCFVKLTEYIAITFNEKTCLSVCRRRQCPTERGDLLGTAGRLAEQSSQEAQIRTLLDKQRGNSCRVAGKNQQTRISSWRSSTTRSTASSRTVIAAKFGITWSSPEKSQWNGRITEIPEFYFRYYRETKTHRGSEHYFGTLGQSTRIAKWRKLYEWYKGVSGCWISSQWKFPRYVQFLKEC